MANAEALLKTDWPHALTLPKRATLQFNDEDNAARILAVHGADLVFVNGRGWAVWDGHRFSLRAGELGAREIGHRLRAIVQEEAEWARRDWEVTPEDVLRFMEACERKRPPVIFRTPEDAISEMRSEFAGRLYAHATKCGNVAKVKSALEACQHQRRAEILDMDADPHAFVVPNGQIDLRAVAAWERPAACEPEEELAARRSWLRPVDRASLPTRVAGVPYDPAAKCPEWEAFMELIVPDAAIRDCVKRIVGAALRGCDAAQIAVLMRGASGGNGKSTFQNALAMVFGDRDGYSATCRVEMFLDLGNLMSNAANPDEVKLPGARVLLATEPKPTQILDMTKIKGLTGCDIRQSRALHNEPFDWRPNAIPFISCNKMPKIKDADGGSRRRLVIIPFEVELRKLPVEQRRKPSDVMAALQREASGILNWAIDGYRDFVARGEEIDPPEAMEHIKSTVFEGADPVRTFLDQMTVADGKGRISVKAAYQVYEKWCDQEGRALWNMKNFGDGMVEAGIERGLYTGRSHWRGIRWSDSAAPLVEEATGEAISRPRSDPPF